MPHRVTWAAVAASLLFPVNALGEEAANPRYEIWARLDASAHIVEGRSKVTVVNHSSRPLVHLEWQLYLNAFSEGSSYSKSPIGEALHAQMRQSGALTVHAMNVQGVDIWATADPVVAGDWTLVGVTLPQPLPSGAHADVEVEWTAELPSLVQRTGFASDFHFVGQWYPKLAKLESNGTFAGAAFHPLAEFYADYADYRVTLDTPEAERVGASGTLTREQVLEGRKLSTFELSRALDFAWSAWPRFSQLSTRLGGIHVQVLYPPGHSANAKETLSTLAQALPYFASRYGPYPYPNLTVVHPPLWANAAGGMEYPTLITTGGSWRSAWLNVDVPTVTVHELAHQWFYGLVASDERRYPFLDEGLASYAEYNFLTTHAIATRLLGLRLPPFAKARMLYGVRAHLPLATAAAELSSLDELAVTAYHRPALLLETLARTYGRAGVDGALQMYAREQRFKHATPESLARALQHHLGEDAAELFRAVAFEESALDYRVSEVLQQACVAGDCGHSRVLVERSGGLPLPIDVLVIEDSGDRHHFALDGRQVRYELTVTTRSPIASAQLDPARHNLLDDDLLNNTWRRSPEPAQRTRAWLTALCALFLAILAP